MDGFEKNEGVILVAATKFPENLDEALRRPGRFDRIVPVRLPDVSDCVKIFEYYLDKLPSRSADIDCEQLARLTVGLSPASLSMIVKHAGLIARKQGASMVCAEHLREAVKVVRIGDVSVAERRSIRTKCVASACMRRGMASSRRYGAPACWKN